MNNCIGIDIAAGVIRAVQVARRRGRPVVLRTCTRELPSGEGPVESGALSALLAEVIREAGFPKGSPAVLGLPCESVFFHNLKTDLVQYQDVRRLLKFELEDDFPVRSEDLVLDLCGCRRAASGYEYLVAAAPRRQIDTWVQAGTAAGLKCLVLSTGVCALHSLACLAPRQDDHPSVVVLHWDGSRMVLGAIAEGQLIGARHLACLDQDEDAEVRAAQEIQLTIRSTLRGCQTLPRVLLTGSPELVQHLPEKLAARTGCEVSGFDFSSLVTAPGAAPVDGQSAIALGLALIGLGEGNKKLNFLSADISQEDHAVQVKTKRSALVAVALVLTVLAMLGIKTFAELRALEAANTAVGKEIRALFTKTFPDEKKIVNELAQTTERLTALRKERDTLAAATGKGIHPLRVLQLLSERLTATKGIGLSFFSVAESTIHVTGTGNSLESVEQYVEELRQVPDFRSVELEDVALTRGSNRPEFRLVISLKVG